MELDIKDRKILEQLELNARQSHSQIGDKVGLSKDAVSYRIKNLEKVGIIKGYYSVLNISKLGYLTYKLMITFQNTNLDIENKIIEYLKKDKNIGWVVSCEGYYNLMIVGWFENPFHFNSFLNSFLGKYSKFIKERHLIMITENHSCLKSYLFDKKEKSFRDFYYGEDMKFDLDEKDIDIIKFISNNSRILLTEIAEKTNLTPEAIAYRLKQLKRYNIIQVFRPIINASLLGYQYYNILFRLKKFKNITKIFEFFRSIPNIVYFVRYLGDYDIGIDVEVKNSQELRRILRDIKDSFGEEIESYNSILVYQEHKLSYSPK